MYLLDTHVFLWTLSAPHRLSSGAAAAIQDPDHAVFVSAVTAVEIAIKKALGKLTAPEQLAEEITNRGLMELPLKFVHGECLQGLEKHHQDPFDRMLVAQAYHEKLTLITHDRKLKPYNISILWP